MRVTLVNYSPQTMVRQVKSILSYLLDPLVLSNELFPRPRDLILKSIHPCQIVILIVCYHR